MMDRGTTDGRLTKIDHNNFFPCVYFISMRQLGINFFINVTYLQFYIEKI